jgi:hypothetical protein
MKYEKHMESLERLRAMAVTGRILGIGADAKETNRLLNFYLSNITDVLIAGFELIALILLEKEESK